MPWEITPIHHQQRHLILRHQIHFSTDELFLPRLKASYAEVRVQATSHALKELLIGLKRYGKVGLPSALSQPMIPPLGPVG
jgi:hypothetical protein